MKLYVAAMLSLLSVLSTPSAHAKDIPLIEMSGEGTKVHIPLGVQVADANPKRLEGIYYRDDAGGRQYFGAGMLKEMTVVYTYKRKYNAAALQLSVAGADAYDLEIRFLRNGIRDTYDSVTLRLAYNYHTQRYEAVDPSTNRVVTQAHIIPNRVWPVGMVGIEDLQLR